MERLFIVAVLFWMAVFLAAIATPAPACGFLEACNQPARHHARQVRVSRRAKTLPVLARLRELDARLSEIETAQAVTDMRLRAMDIRIQAFAASATKAHERITGVEAKANSCLSVSEPRR